MKKTVRILAVVMIVTTLALTLVACSKMLRGKYVADISGMDVYYDFNGKEVTRYIGAGGYGKTEEGTYEIVKEDGEYVIKLTFGDRTETYSFAQGRENGEKYIKIDGRTFTKE